MAAIKSQTTELQHNTTIIPGPVNNDSGPEEKFIFCDMLSLINQEMHNTF